MTLQEYQQQASRTCPDLGSREKNLLHMKLGMLTEVAEIADIFKKNMAYGKEVDLIHLQEELGDLMWYCINYDRMIGKLYSEDKGFPETSVEFNEEQLAFIASPEFKEEVVELLLEVRKESCLECEGLFSTICLAYGFKTDVILDTNINKLKVRYPTSFNHYDAIHRNLEKEREKLEE